MKSISLDEDQIDDSQLNKSQDLNPDFQDLFEKEIEPGEIPGQIEEGKDDWIKADLDEKSENELEIIKSAEFQTDDSDESDEELPDWIKSVVEKDEIKGTEDFELDSEDNLSEFSSISEEEQTEKKEEFTISFDENDEFPDTEELDLEKSGFDANLETDEFEDELEEKFADQTLSQLEKDMISEIEELPSFKEEEELVDFLKESEDTNLSPESSKEDIESTIAWMEGLVAAQNEQPTSDDLVEQEPEESVEEKPEWISEILDSTESDFADMDTTPSWLRELEIEADNVGIEPEIPESFLEESKISELDIDEIEELELQSEDFVEEEESGSVEETAKFEIEPESEEPSIEFDSKLTDGDQIASDAFEHIDEEIEIVADKETEKLEEEVEFIPELIEEQKQDFMSDLADLEAENVEDSLGTQTEEMEKQVEEMPPEESILDQEQEPILAGSEMSLETEFEPEESPGESEIAETELVSGEEISEEPTEEFVEIIPGSEEVSKGIDDLEEAKKLLTSGEVDQSINVFKDLIKENIFLEDIISNIQNALDHHYPINIDLWKTLGDAFLKNKQFQKALDAYSKAEDLLS